MNLKTDTKQGMKKIAVVSLTIAMMMVLLAMAGCASRDDDLVGRWVFEGNADWVTIFNEDGTGTHSQSWGYGTTFEWTTPGNSIRWDYPGRPAMDTPYRISDGALYITLEDGTTYRYLRD